MIFDVFSGQVTERVQQTLVNNNCQSVYVPPNMTHLFQPLDLVINNMAKQFLKNKFEEWYAEQVASQIQQGKDIQEVKVDTKMSRMKPIHARWVVSADAVRKSFDMAGITFCLDNEIEPEDPFNDLDD